MELRQLKYFKTLAHELHFNRAAEKLFIVQPALTKLVITPRCGLAPKVQNQ